MVNSRALGDLRSDVRANCEELLRRCAERGLSVLITQTLRDNEYQAQLYAQGRTRPGGVVTNAKTVSFHGCGLAFDFCKNIRGHEYDDPAFFAAVADIARTMGFSWGGDWRDFPDRPHIQWDKNGAYSAAMVRAGKLPPLMPRCEKKEEADMTQQRFDELMEQWLKTQAEKEPAEWSAEARAWAEENGLITGDETGSKKYCSFVTREQLAVILKRLADGRE